MAGMEDLGSWDDALISRLDWDGGGDDPLGYRGHPDKAAHKLPLPGNAAQNPANQAAVDEYFSRVAFVTDADQATDVD
jgi:hypothetical protein